MPAAQTNTAGMSPAQVAAAMQQQQKEQNRRFMALCNNKEALCLQANGGALQQAYAAGQPLTYNVPTANNAFLTGFWVRFSGTITPAAGTNAQYQLNAGAPLNILDSIQVQYGGTQHNFRPYIWKYLSQLRGQLQQIQPRSPLAGQEDSYLQSFYSSANFPVITNVGNTWFFALYIPMNMLHPQDARGLLPVQQGETKAQVVVNCAGSAFGVDPILNAISLSSGSNGGVTVSGNVTVIAEYKDGQTYTQLAAMQPNLSGLDTVQLLRDTPLNNLGAGQIYRNKVSFLKKIPWLIATIVDGNSSTKFCSTSNIQVIQASADETGNRPFFTVGLNTNLDVREFYNDLSGKFGGLLNQDLDEGILPFVYGPIFQQADADLLEGHAYLDCTTATGWTDYHYGVQLASVGGVTGIAPRIEAHVMLLNDPLVQL